MGNIVEQKGARVARGVGKKDQLCTPSSDNQGTQRDLKPSLNKKKRRGKKSQ